MVKQWARKALAAMIKGAEAGDMHEVARRFIDFKDSFKEDEFEVFSEISGELARAILFKEKADVLNVLGEFSSLMPPYTYGEIPAGTEFVINPCPVLMIKRKDGVEVSTLAGRLPHFAAARQVMPLDR